MKDLQRHTLHGRVSLLVQIWASLLGREPSQAQAIDKKQETTTASAIALFGNRARKCTSRPSLRAAGRLLLGLDGGVVGLLLLGVLGDKDPALVSFVRQKIQG
jgi:hypothetical protein